MKRVVLGVAGASGAAIAMRIGELLSGLPDVELHLVISEAGKRTIAHELGIEKYDIYGSSVDDTSVEVFQGEPKQVQASNRSSVIVRVWNENHQVGVTSTTDVDPSGLKLALKTFFL